MKLKAYAKINPVLDVVGKRKDGYHIIDSVFQSVSLYDEISLEKGDKISVICDNSTLCGEENIAFKAAREFFLYSKIAGGVKIKIKKNIPFPAGLGGGSADAAAVIRGLNLIYETKFSDEELMKIGLKVGADVPFCIIGGTKRVGGIGEEIRSVPEMPECYFVLLKEGEKPSTKGMYEKIDSLNPKHPDIEGFVAALSTQNITEIAPFIGNSFEAVYKNADAKSCFKNSHSLSVSLSGSGPTVFAVFKELRDAEKIYEDLKRKGKEVYLCYPSHVGVE